MIDVCVLNYREQTITLNETVIKVCGDELLAQRCTLQLQKHQQVKGSPPFFKERSADHVISSKAKISLSAGGG
jgi:hypothetical protein